VEHIEGNGLRRDRDAAARDARHGERPEAKRVADHIEVILKKDDRGVGALHIVLQ
jgi:hypothetical protein